MSVKAWRRHLVAPTTAVVEVMALLNSCMVKIALVVDEAEHLIGTVTDGDIRRGILRGIGLNGAAREVMCEQPTTIRAGAPREAVAGVMRRSRLAHLPVLDASGRVCGLETSADLGAAATLDNWVVLMAGGRGVRLRPLTENLPKPLLKVGDEPILQRIIKNFANQGFHRFFVSVNYNAAMLIDHFGDGTALGVELGYLHEDEPRGTAGALTLLPQRPDQPIVVMNGDLMTSVNFVELLDFHARAGAAATMCVREHVVQVPYGVVRTDGASVIAVEEKPVQRFIVNAGIYVLEPSCLDLIPDRGAYDMPTLFDRLVAEGRFPSAFPIHEYWIDIGNHDDLARANQFFDGAEGSGQMGFLG